MSETKQGSTDKISFQGKVLRPALIWVVAAAPQSPGDCFVKLSDANHFLRFQKKGAASRKSLLQVLAKSGVFEIYISEDHYRQYVDLVEQIIESGYAKEKIASFKQQGQHYQFLFPVSAKLPYHIQQLLKEIGLGEAPSSREKIKFPDYPKDVQLITSLYEDIDLNSASMEKTADNVDKIEIENLKRKLSAAQAEIEQYVDSVKDLEAEVAKGELEVRKSLDELSKTQGAMNKLNDEHEDIKRKYTITKNELEDLLSGQKDAKQIYANRISSLEKRMEEIRQETQDFKLKYAREVDKTKELQRNLNQSQNNLTKTAAALKKFTEKKTA